MEWKELTDAVDQAQVAVHKRNRLFLELIKGREKGLCGWCSSTPGNKYGDVFYCNTCLLEVLARGRHVQK